MHYDRYVGENQEMVIKCVPEDCKNNQVFHQGNMSNLYERLEVTIILYMET